MAKGNEGEAAPTMVFVHVEPGRGPRPYAFLVDVRPRERSHRSKDPTSVRTRADDPDADSSGCRVGISVDRPGPHVVVVRAMSRLAPGGERRVPVTVRAGTRTDVRVIAPPIRSRNPWTPTRAERNWLFGPPQLLPGGRRITLTGRVVDGSTGRPLRGVIVSDLAIPEFESWDDVPGGYDPGTEVPPVRTNASGAFRLSRISAHPSFPRKVTFRREGFWTTARNYSFPTTGRTPEFRIELRPAGVVGGVVRNLKGIPIPGVVLCGAWGSPTPGSLGDGESTMLTGTGFRRSRTDSRGRFTLSPLPTDRWIRLMVTAPFARLEATTLLSLSPDRRMAAVDLCLQPAGCLVVEFPEVDVDTLELRVSAKRSDGRAIVEHSMTSYRTESAPLRCDLRSDSLPPGLVSVEVESGVLMETLRRRIRIRAGKTSTLRIPARALRKGILPRE